MEIKIKDKNTLIDAIIEVVNGVMIVSPREEKWIPKNGDVVTSGCSYEVISIFKSQSNVIAYKSHISIYEEELHTDDCFMMKNIRPATEEEKQKLFDKLKEEGLEWDADKRELVKVKWKPKIGETYYRPAFLHCEFICYSGITDYNKMVYIKDHINKGWVFRTEEECEEFCRRLNKAIEGVKP